MLTIILMQLQIKLLKKMLTKNSNKYEGDNLDKSSELIFDYCEEKIEIKIKNSKVDAKSQRESETISNNILFWMEVSEIYTDSRCSKED